MTWNLTPADISLLEDMIIMTRFNDDLHGSVFVV